MYSWVSYGSENELLPYTNGLYNGNARAFCGVGTEESLIII